MSEGGGNKISVVFCYRSSKKDEIKTYLPEKEKWGKTNNVITKMTS